MPFPTKLLPVPLAPEISLHLVDRPVGLFELIGEDYRSDRPPPFWAFAWAGGQALARYVLDHPETVRGKTVEDLATGSGVAAIAAALAGAAAVSATDVDPEAVAAAHRNAAANHVALRHSGADPGVILAGDVFYSPTVAEQMSRRLRQHRRKQRLVLVGDPGRGYFPERLFEPVAEYTVPVSVALEEAESLATTVWRMR
ncbi:class I SAM-dependent methyltransferase [Actinoplanes subtropicus]|uniref:class I SAM-dependent methyltransferase n=1 Tax=Actinoplanes subtropicus TaxID=543632 RepID=UPI0004C3A773|nr:50S ribosomal protein L11 methyltransferase [Actinoplanes subtropicus]